MRETLDRLSGSGVNPQPAASGRPGALRDFTLSGALSIGSQLVWGLQGFVTFVMAGRFLPQREFGFVVAANAILFGGQCLLLGPVTNPTLRFGAVSSKSLRFTYGLYFAVTCAVCSAFVFGAQWGRLIYPDRAFIGLVRYLGIPFAATTFYAVQKLVLFARMRYGTVLAMDVLFTVTNVAALIFLHAGSLLTSALGFYMARSAAALAGLLPAAALYLRAGSAAAAPEPPFHYKDYLSHSKYSSLAMFSGYGQNQVDALAVAHFLDPMRAAAYGAAKVFYTGIALVTTGLTMVVLPASSRIAFGRTGDMGRLYRRALLAAYALLAPACALLALVAAPALRICFGNRYADAAPLIRIFCLASLAMPLSSITDAVANGAGWWRRACVAAISGGIVGASASLLLTPALGVSGAAIGPVLGISCTALVLVSLTWKRLRAGGAWRQFLSASDAAGAAR